MFDQQRPDVSAISGIALGGVPEARVQSVVRDLKTIMEPQNRISPGARPVGEHVQLANLSFTREGASITAKDVATDLDKYFGNAVPVGVNTRQAVEGIVAKEKTVGAVQRGAIEAYCQAKEKGDPQAIEKRATEAVSWLNERLSLAQKEMSLYGKSSPHFSGPQSFDAPVRNIPGWNSSPDSQSDANQLLRHINFVVSGYVGSANNEVAMLPLEADHLRALYAFARDAARQIAAQAQGDTESAQAAAGKYVMEASRKLSAPTHKSGEIIDYVAGFQGMKECLPPLSPVLKSPFKTVDH